MGEIWFVALQFEGKLQGVSLELAGEAKLLAQKAGTACGAVLFSSDIGDMGASLFAAGADKVYCVCAGEYARYSTDLFANGLMQLADKYHPGAILIPATSEGRDLAPRLGAGLKTGVCADCTELDFDTDSNVVLWTRPALGGNLLATIVCEHIRPQLGTVRPGVFPVPPNDFTHNGSIVEFTPLPCTDRVKILACNRLERQEEKIEAADIIITVGRGMADADGLKLVRELAKLLPSAVIGGTRPVVDMGLISPANQVGQSGKTVRPRLYIALGVSGACQHLCGMQHSQYIIAVNKDLQAPIMKIADIGLVGDAGDITKNLIGEIRNKGGK